MNKQQTPLNTTFIGKAVQLAKDFDTSANCAWLSDYRQSQIALLEQATFPHKRIEHFKYNRLHGFDHQDYNAIAESDNNAQLSEEHHIDNITQNETVAKIVFVNGILDTEQSAFSNHQITSFEQTNEQQQQAIINALQSHDVTQNPFILFNASLSDNGVYIKIDENSPAELIEVVSINTNTAQDQTTANQIVIDVDDRCKAVVVSRSISQNKDTPTALSTCRINANVGENANFTHYHLSIENTNSLRFASICYNLQSHCTLKTFHAITGGNLKKLDVQANHLGQHAHATLNGLYVATDDEQVDFHTEVNHPQPHGTTDENFRGLVNGNAEAVFNGRIQIYEDAQKTLAEMSNKNLILSDTAQLHTKPELEIYADDVICAHGATVSRLQDTALNYLRARGISKNEGELMLSYAFFDELLGESENEAVADYVRPILFSTIGVQ